MTHILPSRWCDAVWCCSSQPTGLTCENTHFAELMKWVLNWENCIEWSRLGDVAPDLMAFVGWDTGSEDKVGFRLKAESCKLICAEPTDAMHVCVYVCMYVEERQKPISTAAGRSWTAWRQRTCDRPVVVSDRIFTAEDFSIYGLMRWRRLRRRQFWWWYCFWWFAVYIWVFALLNLMSWCVRFLWSRGLLHLHCNVSWFSQFVFQLLFS